MKKNIFAYLIALIILTVLISLFFLFGGKNEVKDTKCPIYPTPYPSVYKKVKKTKKS